MLVRITSNFFCAGFVFNGKWNTKQIAPILIRFIKMNGWSLKKLKQYCQYKGWKYEIINNL